MNQTVKPLRVHYAGALRIVRGERLTQISSGFAACAFGQRAWNVRRRGNHTYDPEKVTCRRCNYLMALAGVTAKLVKP